MLLKNNLVLYEIYPRSFRDLNGDGYGDLPGIISKLDYLKALGITAIWLTPLYPSPMKDCGYDITDYMSINPESGTMNDFSSLVQEAHARNMLVVLDLVVNHTSDQHPWFIASRSSKDNPKRDWYIWHDPVNGSVPNNWKSVFDPSVWEYDGATQQYYYHSYLKEQPDLNWKNPQVIQAVKEICAFWLDKGVDGLRLDGVNYYWKDQRFLDEPVNPKYNPALMAPFYQLDHIYMKDQEEHYALVQDLGKFVKEYADGFLIPQAHPAKTGIEAIDRYKKYYEIGTAHNVVPFNFELIELPWNAASYGDFITAFLHALEPDDIPLFVLGSHDRPRVASRIGQDQARAAAVLQLTLPGIPVIYYGDELGIENVHPIPTEKIHDTKELRSPGFGRDPFRTPMQWDSSVNAGFSEAEPWLPLEKEYKDRNVASEMKDPASMLHLYTMLLNMRKEHADVLVRGKFTTLARENPEIFGYVRSAENKKYFIYINFSAKKASCQLRPGNYRQILSSVHQCKREDIIYSIVDLEPFEALVLAEVLL